MAEEEKKAFPAFREATKSNSNSGGQFLILVAEDDEDDYFLIEEAFEETGARCKLDWVKDGEELLNYLAPLSEDDRPALIILDLNMPKISGFDALREIKSDSNLRRIPIIILTTSQSEDDVVQCYDLGVNSFIQKPIRFEVLVETIETLHRYWFKIAKLPTTL